MYFVFIVSTMKILQKLLLSVLLYEVYAVSLSVLAGKVVGVAVSAATCQLGEAQGVAGVAGLLQLAGMLHTGIDEQLCGGDAYERAQFAVEVAAAGGGEGCHIVDGGIAVGDVLLDELPDLVEEPLVVRAQRGREDFMVCRGVA